MVLSKSNPSQIKPKARDQQITYYWSQPTGGTPTDYILTVGATPYTIPYPETSYTVTGLTNGTEYTANIVASNGGGTSAPAYYRTVQPGFKPDPPTNIIVIKLTTSSALVSWTAPIYTGQATIKWYLVKAVSNNILDPVIRLSVYGYSRKWLVTNLNPASTYTFTVYAVNNPGYSVGASSSYIVQSGLLVWLDATPYSGSGAWSNLTGNSAFDATIEYGAIAKNTAGNGIVLNGVSSWQFSDIGSRTNWTLSVWFKQTGTVAPGNAEPAIVTQNVSANGANMYIWSRQGYNGNFAGGFRNLNGILDGNQNAFLLYVWQHMVVTWDSTNLKTYINGTLINTTGLSGQTSSSSGEKYRIGHRWDQDDSSSIYFVTGEIGEVLIYNRALTAGEVAYNYAVTSAIYPFYPSDFSNLLIWLDMADSNAFTTSGGDIISMTDKSGNGNTMNQLPPNPAYPPVASVFPVPGTPINGLTTAYFSAPAGIKMTGTELNGVTDFFWVGRQYDEGINYSFFLGDDVNYDWHGTSSTYIWGLYAQPGIQNASATIFTNGSSTTDLFVNISIVSNATVFMISAKGITGNTRFQGLCYDRINSGGWIGDFGELICYNSALTNDQFTVVQNYLRNKWNII